MTHIPANRELSAEILRLYSETGQILVFPSQVAAQSWSRRVAGIRGVSLGERFISWDEFKERTFFGQEIRRPVNSLARSLFLENFLRENRRSPLLKSIIPPKFKNRAELYKPTLKTLLPLLAKIVRAGSMRLEELLGASLAADLLAIHRAYSGFLDKYQRYEPSWLPIRFVSDGNPYVILYPELIDDFLEYRAELSDREEIALLSLESIRGDGLNTEYREFSDYREEIITLLSDVADSLRDGQHPEDMAISLAGYDAVLPRLLYYAQSAGIPLVPRRGRPLLEYPSVSWLGALRDAYSADFSFNSVRKLMFHPGLPWKHPELPRRIVEAGVAGNILEGGRRRWSRIITGISGGSELFAALEGIQEAATVEDLYRAVYVFFSSYIDTSRWSSGDEGAWQRAAESLHDLAQRLREFTEIEVHPFTLSLEILSGVSYLPQQSGAGVPVFDYRVAAGMFTGTHYCVNFSSDASAVRDGSSRIFREDVIADLLGVQANSGDDFIRAYGISGQRVWVSVSRVVRGTSVLPARQLIGREPTPCNTEELIARWNTSVMPGQKSMQSAKGSQGLDQNAGAAGGSPVPPWNTSGLRLDADPWMPPPEPELKARLGLEGSSLAVTSLEEFLHCRFSYLWSCLKLEKLETRPNPYPGRLVGIAFHRIMEDLLRWIRQESYQGRYDAQRIDEYHAYAQTLMRRSFGSDRNARFFGVPETIQQQLRPRFLSAALRILDTLAEQADGWIISTEEKLSVLVPTDDGGEVSLSGRIDLRLSGSDGAAIYDYKTGASPSTGEILGTMRSRLPKAAEQREMGEGEVISLLSGDGLDADSLQLPAYSLMIRERGEAVVRGGYFSAARNSAEFAGSYREILNICGGDVFPLSSNLPIRHEAVLRLLEDGVGMALRTWNEALRSGNFTDDGGRCTSCRFPQLCRRGFAVKMGDER